MNERENTTLEMIEISRLMGGTALISKDNSVVLIPTELAPLDDYLTLQRLHKWLGDGPLPVKEIKETPTRQIILSIESDEGVLTEIDRRYLAKWE